MSRSQIIIEARSWIGTRFHHQGRIKKTENSKGGCDCIGLIIGVASNLDIKCKGRPLVSFDRTNYSRIPDGESLKNSLDYCLSPINIDSIQLADILLMRINKEPQHVAFVGVNDEGGLSLIHCYMQARGVVEHALDGYWKQKIVAAYSLLDD